MLFYVLYLLIRYAGSTSISLIFPQKRNPNDEFHTQEHRIHLHTPKRRIKQSELRSTAMAGYPGEDSEQQFGERTDLYAEDNAI